MKDYRELCIELFGTDDENELRKIAGRLRGGRKKSLTEKDIENAIKMQGRGMSTKKIADYFGVSRQTISKYLNKPLTDSYVMRLDFILHIRIACQFLRKGICQPLLGQMFERDKALVFLPEVFGIAAVHLSTVK